jgi:hypothetical protein
MNNNLLQVPFLISSRDFPEDPKRLTAVLGRSYLDIANAVNNRTISVFPTSKPAQTGETWMLDQNNRFQTLRQVYSFGAIAAGANLDIPHGLTNLTQFTRIWGTVVTTAVDYRPLPYIDPASLTTGMTILVGTVLGVPVIRIALGATAVPVTRGLAILEYLTDV